MRTQPNTKQTSKGSIVLVALIVLTLALPVSAQLKSRSVSVALVARMPESVTVHYQPVPLAPALAEQAGAAVDVYLVSLAWRLRPGQSLQVQPVLEKEDEAQPVLSADGFVSLRRLVLESQLLGFRSRTESGAGLLGAVADGEEKPVGQAAFIIGAAAPRSAPSQTVRISIAIL